jgi:glycosidase
MPDWNLTNPDVVTHHHDNLRFWLNRGVDGFRFDAVSNLVENGPVAPQRFGAAGVCGSAFAFDISSQISNAAMGDTTSIQAVSRYFVTAPPGMSVMVSNHDSFAGPRLWNQVNGDGAAYRLAAATYLLLPGTPFIYYGEEIGQSDSLVESGDAGLRSPMSWTVDAGNAGFTTAVPYRSLSGNVATNNVAAQVGDANSLLAFYRAMLALRNTRPSIAQGAYVAPFANGTVMGFQRTFGAETTLVLMNYGATAANVVVASLPANGTLAALHKAGGGTTAVDGAGMASLVLAAKSVNVFAVTP